jgi:hypothetical protein
MAEITEDQPTTTHSTIVRNLEEKGYVAHNVWKHASVPYCSY